MPYSCLARSCERVLCLITQLTNLECSMCNLVILRTITRLNSACFVFLPSFYWNCNKFHPIIFPCCLHDHRFMRFSAMPLTRFEISSCLLGEAELTAASRVVHTHTHTCHSPCSRFPLHYFLLAFCLSRLQAFQIIDWLGLLLSGSVIFPDLRQFISHMWPNLPQKQLSWKRLHSIILYFTRGVAFGAILYS